jgi:hypothetical protein
MTRKWRHHGSRTARTDAAGANADAAGTNHPRPRKRRQEEHGCMARGGHGLPKVSPRPSMPYPYTPCGRATPETALRSFPVWPAHRAGSRRPSSTSLDTPGHTPMKRKILQETLGNFSVTRRMRQFAGK